MTDSLAHVYPSSAPGLMSTKWAAEESAFSDTRHPAPGTRLFGADLVKPALLQTGAGSGGTADTATTATPAGTSKV